MEAFYGLHGISKWPAPSYGREFQIDEAVLQEAINDEIAYFNPRAVDHDINSIRSIYALRKGLAPTRLENAKAVLVTTNTRLARVAYRFGREHESMREVSSVITDFSLGNVAWLKAPLGSDLPRREILATCYAAMQPPPKLWNQYLDEITKLRSSGEVSPADHEALRLSLIAREELMNLTLGEEKAFSRRTVEQILETVKLEYTRTVTAQLEDERKARLATEQKAGGLERQHEERRKRLFWWCARAGRVGGIVAMALVIPAVFAGALAATYSFGAYLQNSWLTSLANAAIGFFTVWSILDLVVGLSVKEAADWLSRSLHAGLYRLVCRIEDIDPAGAPGD
ncbi:MAG: hypothetical protein H0W20_05720 [Chthoniobacterales bacterium]|nr:hypothetical protein [Chthoniobacterales bacterium]